MDETRGRGAKPKISGGRERRSAPGQNNSPKNKTKSAEAQPGNFRDVMKRKLRQRSPKESGARQNRSNQKKKG
jgi:hypothetical protein